MIMKNLCKNLSSTMKQKLGTDLINFINSSKKEECIYNMYLTKIDKNNTLIELANGTTYISINDELIDSGMWLLE